jgi:hypothetical protein
MMLLPIVKLLLEQLGIAPELVGMLGENYEGEEPEEYPEN